MAAVIQQIFQLFTELTIDERAAVIVELTRLHEGCIYHKPKKDRTAPVKPRTPYMFFSAFRNKELGKQGCKLKVGDRAKIIAEEWKAMTEEDKSKYVDMQSADIARYHKEKKEYENRKADDLMFAD
jgi:hypothetical protein